MLWLTYDFQHLLTHMRKETPCPGCDRTFVSRSAMVLHLERGTCASGANLGDIHEAAYHTATLDDDYVTPDRELPFACPSCGGFRFMSGLLQHVESERCDERLGWYGPLDNFLEELADRIRWIL